MTEPSTSLDDEIELITASLLPVEQLKSSDPGTWPRIVDITSTDNELSLRVQVEADYPLVSAVHVEIRGNVGREEAENWKQWTEERMKDWQDSEEYPLYQLLTTHFLPLLAPSSPSPSPPPDPPPLEDHDGRPHHALLTSHHLLAPSKRKDLQHLSSKLSLVGFAKTGHPGIMYATGDKQDLEEWVREVKTWQWLALRVRMTPEPLPEGSAMNLEGNGVDNMGRGDWTELTKINEALDWLKARGRENILTGFAMDGQPRQEVRAVPEELRTYIREKALRFTHEEYTEYLVSQIFQDVKHIDSNISPDLAHEDANPLLALSTGLARCAPVAEARQGVPEAREVKREAKRAIMSACRLQQESKDGTFHKKQLRQPVRDPLPLELRPQLPILSRIAMRCTPRIFSPAKDRNRRVPTKLVQLFKEKGKFKAGKEIPMGPYEDVSVTLEDALLLERDISPKMRTAAVGWTRSMKIAYIQLARKTRDAKAPASWEKMMESTKHQIESAPRPISPSVLPRSLLERKTRNMADLSKISKTYRAMDWEGLGEDELRKLLNPNGGRDERGFPPLSAFETQNSRPTRASTLHVNAKATGIFSIAEQGQVVKVATLWKTKKMQALARDLQPDMHVMSLSNIRATEAVRQRDEWIKHETSSAMSTPRAGFRPRKDRIVSPPSGPSGRQLDAPQLPLRPFKEVVVMAPPPAPYPSPSSSLQRTKQAPGHLVHRLPRVHEPSPSIGSTMTGSTISSGAAAAPPTSITAQLANRKNAHYRRERERSSTPEVQTPPIPRPRQMPASRPRSSLRMGSKPPMNGNSMVPAARQVPIARSRNVGMPRKTAQHRTPSSYKDLSAVLVNKFSQVDIPDRMVIASISLDTISDAADCAPEPRRPIPTEIVRKVVLPLDLAQKLLHPALLSFGPLASPHIGPSRLIVSMDEDVEPAFFDEDIEHEEPWSPLKISDVKQFTYMPIPKASSSKLPSSTVPPTSLSQSAKKQKTKHIILQDSGSLDDIVRLRAQSLTPVDGKPRRDDTIADTLDGHLQLLGKAEQVQKRIASKVQPKPIRPELLAYAAARPKSTVPPAPVKKVDWRDHPLLKNPVWYEKMANSSQGPSVPDVTLLAAMPLYRNRPLVSALEDGGFTLLEHDLPGQGVDLVLSASTAVIFRPLNEIVGSLRGGADCIKLASQYFQRILLVVEVAPYRHQGSARDVNVNPLTAAALTVLPDLQRTITSSLQDKSSGPIGKVDVIMAKRGAVQVVKVLRSILDTEFAGLRQAIGNVEAAELCGTRGWLESGDERQAQYLTVNFHLSSFSAAYVLLKSKSAEDFLYEWTEGDRKLQFGHVIGDKIIKRINESLRPKPDTRHHTPPSSDPLNLRPPSA